MNGEKSILFVDDDEDILAGLEALATSRLPGVQVYLARDPQTGLETLRAHDCAVVVSDYRLRNAMDGGQFLLEVARLRPKAARIALASMPDSYLIELGRQGSFAVMSKPISETLLVTMLRHHLGKSTNSKADAAAPLTQSPAPAKRPD